MIRLHMIYVGPDRDLWKPGECYDLQLSELGRTRIHVGTRAGHNEYQGVPAPTPLRLRSIRRFFDLFRPVERHSDSAGVEVDQ